MTIRSNMKSLRCTRFYAGGTYGAREPDFGSVTSWLKSLSGPKPSSRATASKLGLLVNMHSLGSLIVDRVTIVSVNNQLIIAIFDPVSRLAYHIRVWTN